jgi:hypothetical protein
MTEDIYFVADPPTTGYIVTMVCIAVAGTLGLPFMIWLVFTAIFRHNWALVIAALFAGLICAGMLQSWKGIRSAMRQRKDGKRHSITITSQKFIYCKDNQIQEIPLVDIVSIEDRLESSIGNQARSIKITYTKADDKRGELMINAMEFSKAWENQGKFGALLWDAICTNRG